MRCGVRAVSCSETHQPRAAGAGEVIPCPPAQSGDTFPDTPFMLWYIEVAVLAASGNEKARAAIKIVDDAFAKIIEMARPAVTGSRGPLDASARPERGNDGA